MQFIFLSSTGEQLAMPVTPSGYVLTQGRLVDGLDMALTGQVNLPGLQSLFAEEMTFLLPSSARSYTAPGYAGQPYDIVSKLVSWSNKGDVVRLIITGTPINVPVLLGPVRYGENDGTRDVTVTMDLREYRQLAQAKTVTNPDTGNAPRQEAASPPPAASSYTIKSGDNLWAICQKFYGDGALAYKLAAANGVKNANLIYPKQELKIPPRDQL